LRAGAFGPHSLQRGIFATHICQFFAALAQCRLHVVALLDHAIVLLRAGGEFLELTVEGVDRLLRAR
jgi:hypothetical protein